MEIIFVNLWKDKSGRFDLLSWLYSEAHPKAIYLIIFNFGFIIKRY